MPTEPPDTRTLRDIALQVIAGAEEPRADDVTIIISDTKRFTLPRKVVEAIHQGPDLREIIEANSMKLPPED